MKRTPSRLITPAEIQTELECSKSTAYGVIRVLNKELADRGFLTVRGKVPRAYFEERFKLA